MAVAAEAVAAEAAVVINMVITAFTGRFDQSHSDNSQASQILYMQNYLLKLKFHLGLIQRACTRFFFIRTIL